MSSHRFILYLCSLLGLLALPALAEETRGVPREFFHFAAKGQSRQHAPKEWLKEGEQEQPRDCRGCHSFAGNDIAAWQPTLTCTKCHHGGSLAVGTQPPSYRWHEKELAGPGGARGSSFTHSEHLKLDCRQCHQGGNPGRFGVVGSEDMGVPVGSTPGSFEVQYCIECHDPASPGWAAKKDHDPDPTAQKFCAALNSSTSMGASAFRGFRHDFHLTAKDLAAGRGNAESCGACHSEILVATDVSKIESTFDRASCQACHITTGAPVTFKTNKWQSTSAGTFLHSDHPTDKDDCTKCHVLDGATGSFAFKAGDSKYESSTPLYSLCMSCHHHQEGFQKQGSVDPKEYVHGDEHPRGNSERSISCAECHAKADSGTLSVEDALKVMKTNRAWAKPTRSVLGQPFGFASHAHPGITPTPAEDCSKCHVAAVATVPSRLTEKSFSHATHMGATPVSENCNECHIEVGNSAGSEALTAIFQSDACSKCHLGTQAVAGAQKAARSVMQFPHSKHVGKNFQENGSVRAMACLDCHAPFGEEEGTLQAAADCSKCHGHDTPEKKQHSSDLGADTVRACVMCHREDVPSRREAPAPHLAEIAGIESGSQQHPLPAEKACAVCHTAPTRSLRLISEDRARGTPNYESKKFHVAYPVPTGGTKAESCLDCHWADEKDGRLNDAALRALLDPAKKYRELLGKDMQGYPGGVK